MPGLKLMFRNSLSAEGAKAVKIKAWALKARMLMPNSGRFVRLCVVRLCVRLTILNLFKVYMNLSLRFFHFKFFKVLKQIMYLWFKWIMERCYPHLRWYFLQVQFVYKYNLLQVQFGKVEGIVAIVRHHRRFNARPLLCFQHWIRTRIRMSRSRTSPNKSKSWNIDSCRYSISCLTNN